jgi:2'-5' RNA ligase
MRLFVGIALPEEIRDLLVDLTGGIPGADWVDPDSYHVTLRFIGEVGRAHAEEIDAALAELVAPPFAMSLTGVDFFQTAGRPRVLWARVEPSGSLSHLARKVDRAVVQTELPSEERAFVPHVTIARLRDVTLPKVMAFVQHNALFRAGPIPVDRFVLFESLQGRGGPVYHPLAEYLLGVPADAAG